MRKGRKTGKTAWVNMLEKLQVSHCVSKESIFSFYWSPIYFFFFPGDVGAEQHWRGVPKSLGRRELKGRKKTKRNRLRGQEGANGSEHHSAATDTLDFGRWGGTQLGAGSSSGWWRTDRQTKQCSHITSLWGSLQTPMGADNCQMWLPVVCHLYLF